MRRLRQLGAGRQLLLHDGSDDLLDDRRIRKLWAELVCCERHPAPPMSFGPAVIGTTLETNADRISSASK